MAILIFDKIDLKAKKISREKEEHYVMVKRSIHQEGIMTLNMYTPIT